MRIPRVWTDADGIIESGVGDKTVFSVEAIRELTELVEALRRRSQPERLQAS
jgi:hypothetical protein